MSAALAERRWEEVGDAPDAVLVVPIGATEQHGPHLPLATDTVIAVALAERLVAARGHLVLAPPLAYGASGEHADFPGTVSIGQAATERVLVELGRSVSASFGRLLLINAHGGNAVPLQAAVRTLVREGRDVRAHTPGWGGDAHAGRSETSLMLAIAPQSVRLELAQPGVVQPIAELIDRLRCDGVRAVSPNGVLGDPTGAGAAEGEALLAAAVGELTALVDGWTSR